MSIPDPQRLPPSDNGGQMSIAFWQYLMTLVAYIRALEARIEALENP
jgi:hypothetical protein